MSALLEAHGIEVVAQSAFHVPEAAETGLSFVENALIKARHAARHTSLPALADDSGLCVDALHGAPGIYSSRYAGGGGDQANNEKLLAALEGVEDPLRTARFHCALALVMHEDDPLPLICEASWHGRILRAPRGEGGFGYDPLFQPDGADVAAAQLDPATKNRLSHRGQATRRFLQALTGSA